MHNFIHKYCTIIILGVLVCLSISCSPAAHQPAEQPVVRVNTPPANIYITGPDELKPGTEVALACGAIDADSDILTFTWVADNGTLASNGESRFVKWTSPDVVGEYSVAVTVSDGRGGEGNATKSFKVVENPYSEGIVDKTVYLKINFPSSYAVKESRRVRIWTTTDIQCVVEGKDTSELTYKWSATGGRLAGKDNTIAEGTAATVGWIAPSGAEKYSVKVIVSDKSGYTASGEVDFDVFCCNE